MALIFSYGDYTFDPKPLFSIGKEYIKTAANIGLGTRYTLTIDGQIIPGGGKIPQGDPKAGLNEVFSGVDEIHRAFDSDFKCLALYCDDGSAPIISGYPRITSFNVDHASDNYVVRADYSITLDLPSLTGTGFDPVGPIYGDYAAGCGPIDGGSSENYLDLSLSGLISYSDEFTVEFLDERIGNEPLVLNTDEEHGLRKINFGELPSVFSIQRSISAQGDSQTFAGLDGVCKPYIHPWERAKVFVEHQLELPSEVTGLSGLLYTSTSEVVNNFRTVTVNKTEGIVSVNQTFIAVTGGGIAAYEDFEISTSQSLEEPYVTVTIDGTVNGLTRIDYTNNNDAATPVGQATGEPKFNNAIAFWAQNVSGAIYTRASKVLEITSIQSGHVGVGVRNPFPDKSVGVIPQSKNSLNHLALSQTVGYNPVAGTVTYSYTYDNRPRNCYHHAITEAITFSESEPNDVFASLTVLGRATGPLFQRIGTVGPRTREISINAILPMVTDCNINRPLTAHSYNFFQAPDFYDQMVIDYATVLNTNYNQVFVTASSKTWEPKTGRFTLNQSWTVGTCALSVALCAPCP
jgi:hypothetical protein